MIDYDPHDWRSHLCDIRGSMVREIFARVSLCVLSACAVIFLWRWQRSFVEAHLAIPESVHSLLGFALGLLLVFRTNASYDRFWEGRKQWGSIVNESRNFARSVSACFQNDRKTASHLIQLAILFPWATMNRLRGNEEFAPLESVAGLPESTVARIQSAKHRPLAVTRMISEELHLLRRSGCLSDILLTALDDNMQLQIDYMGACERIHNTPLPFAYVVHLRRALILYCYTLPLALVSKFGWMTIPASLVVSYILFGVEEIGVQIEDPFETDDNDLPLERICTTIERDLREILKSFENDAVALPGLQNAATT